VPTSGDEQLAPGSLFRHLDVEAIVDSEADIGVALEDVSVPALIAAVVHITGDLSYLRGSVRPREFVMNEFQGKMTEEEKAELRQQALLAIVAWRDRGSPPVTPPSDDVIREMMAWVACEPLADDYAAMYAEEMDVAGRNPRAINLSGPAAESRARDLKALIIGCGEGGLLAALRLKEAGIPFEIIEKNSDVGGTWLENRYPGCRVDVASHYYSYSFGPNDGFSEYYARQPELYRYFQRFFDDHQIGEHVRWCNEVERAEWDDAEAVWRVTARDAEGAVHERSANILISAVGILNRPQVPDLPGIARFDGPAFHSAEWDDSVDLRGKRVALIGAGASGFQIGPAIVDEVESLVVFQRTPQWMAPNPRYHAALKPGEQWAMRHLPGYGRWYRFMLMFQSSDKMLELVRADPNWEDFPHTANEFSAQRRAIFKKWIDDQAGDDLELAAKVTPHYPPMAKRMLQDDGSWLRCLRRPHVELITDQITGIDESSVMTADGRFDADVIIFATGFRANDILFPMEIVGRDGISMAETWKGAPKAFRGVSVPGFPNFFILNGPGTGLAHAGSVILTTECQMRYIADAIRTLVEGDHRAIEPTIEAHHRYAEELQAEIATFMWGHPSIEHSWYRAADGNVYIICPWRLVDYWKMTGSADPSDHLVS
jgi:4-hydroxyacetophenone monooxygenase